MNESELVGDSLQEVNMGIGLAETIDPIGNLAHNIIIKPLNYGYSVTVGCQVFAIESTEKLVVTLKEYLTSPKETEKKWFSGELLK